ncbi:MAG: hypothetical protein SPF19_13080 [Oliverpabstia sp.]|nr:hypothetical protein [Lachnospiraceae bacterium]MDY5027432.1 hypothetical protein [Oliverpabstia sp.]
MPHVLVNNPIRDMGFLLKTC